jgi:drug/metabolite transporter (DMT)-like permease
MTQNRTHLAALSKAAFAVVVWGASFIATKIALRDVAPVTVIWLRFGIGVVVLGVIMATKEGFALPSRRELAYFSFLGLQGITFHQWLQVTGLITSQATTTAWIITTIPIFIAVLGWLILSEKLSWGAAGGIALAGVGVLIIVTHGDLGTIFQGHFGAPGDLLILISAPNWAVFSVLSRRGLQNQSATRMLFFVMSFGWIFTSIWLVAAGRLQDFAHLSTGGWIAVLFLGIFCSGLAYIFWYDALKAIPASQVGSLLYLEPLVAVAVAAVLLQEPLLAVEFFGGALILLGVWLVNRRRALESPPD